MVVVVKWINMDLTENKKKAQEGPKSAPSDSKLMRWSSDYQSDGDYVAHHDNDNDKVDDGYWERFQNTFVRFPFCYLEPFEN